VNAFDIALLAVLAAALGLGFWRSRVRTREIRQLAETTGFHYSDNALPRSLGKLPSGITSVWNVLDGEHRGRRVIVFDCKFGEGKGSWRRTVIAIQAERSSISASAFDPEVEVEQIGEWTFLYRPRQLASLLGN
jgi:hypothetical protein